MNPGDTACGPCARGGVCPLNEGRDVNPGDTRPATSARDSRSRALNEGRDVNPGDTVQVTDEPQRMPRSTKAGT